MYMVYELSTEKRKIARVTLEQLSELCPDDDSYYKNHPLLSTQQSSCLVSISRDMDAADNIRQGVIDFSFRDKQGSRLAKTKAAIHSSGDVIFSSSPTRAEGADLVRLMYVYDLFLPLEFRKTIELNPKLEHHLETDIIATEGLAYFIYSSYINRANPLIVPDFI